MSKEEQLEIYLQDAGDLLIKAIDLGIADREVILKEMSYYIDEIKGD